MKIGEIVKNHIPEIVKYCQESDLEEFNQLQNQEYSKKCFKLSSYPFFKNVSSIDKKEKVRFWVDEYEIQGVKVRVCSQWLESHKDRFLNYLIEKNLLLEDNISELPNQNSEDLNEEIMAVQCHIGFSAESEMQNALRKGKSLENLESGLIIDDEGNEFILPSGGRIDIRAKDKHGKIVIIELKAGKAKWDAVGQIMGYMGEVKITEEVDVRGILVANDFDERAKYAASINSDLVLYKYSIDFNFSKL